MFIDQGGHTIYSSELNFRDFPWFYMRTLPKMSYIPMSNDVNYNYTLQHGAGYLSLIHCLRRLNTSANRLPAALKILSDAAATSCGLLRRLLTVGSDFSRSFKLA